MYRVSILIAIIVFSISCKTKKQTDKHIDVINMSVEQLIELSKEKQHELNLQYADKDKSPLTAEDFSDFRSLSFYPIDAKYIVKAVFQKNPNPVSFELNTTTERVATYQKYGTMFFEIDGVKCQLPVYQNLELIKKPEFKNHIFAPFTDLTTGGESYGGGRYLDLELPFGEKVLLDFNSAYNPYCAYNHKYSCVIPPEENDLPVAIKAGVKAYH